MKKTYLLYGFLGVAILSVFFYFLFRSDPSTISVTVHTVTEKSSLYDISVEYPSFSRVSSAFNAEIKKTTEDALTTFKTAALETEKSRKSPSGKGMPKYQYSFITRWMPEELSPHMVSVVLSVSYFTGGAHGSEDIYTFTYDPIQKREVTLDTIFGTAPNYLNRISNYVLSDLKDQLKIASGGSVDMAMIQEGTTPTEEHFSRFSLGPNNTITFYFPAYQVAPYVFGEQKVTMPLSFILSSQ